MAIIKQRAERNDKNVESSSPFAYHNPQNIFDSGKSRDSHKSEVKKIKEKFNYDDKEGKIMDMNRSNESSNIDANISKPQLGEFNWDTT